MGRELLIALAISLMLTLVLEAGFFFVIGKRNRKDLLLVVMVNILTNPAVVLLYWLCAIYTSWNLMFVIIPLEFAAIATEGYCYSKYGQTFKRPYVFSLAANVFSYTVGLILQQVI